MGAFENFAFRSTPTPCSPLLFLAPNSIAQQLHIVISRSLLRNNQSLKISAVQQGRLYERGSILLGRNPFPFPNQIRDWRSFHLCVFSFRMQDWVVLCFLSLLFKLDCFLLFPFYFPLTFSLTVFYYPLFSIYSLLLISFLLLSLFFSS